MMCLKKISLACLIVCLQIVTSFAQTYTVNYKPLSSDILTGSKPIKIGILEDLKAGEKLYGGLIQDNEVKRNYEIYPASVLDANREMLGGELNAQNSNFLKLLNDILRIKYLLQWQMLSDSSGFQLIVYSTTDFSKLYNNNFYFSLNSDPINDVKKFLLENMEPSYEVTFAELQINGTPETAKFKLFRGTELIKEWSGQEKQKIEAGKYKLITEAYGYRDDNREIIISGQNPMVLSVKLQPDISLLPAISSADNLISNITPELQPNQLKIFYDLNGEKGSAYSVSIRLTDKTTKESFDAKQVIGDAENVSSGKSKVLIWRFPGEIRNNSLSNYVMILSADKKGEGLPWYIYAGGGALVVGGAAALLMGGSDEEGGTPNARVKINPPPGRP